MKKSDIPITQEMLYAVRDDLRSAIRSADHKVDSLDSKIKSIDSKFDSIDSRIQSMDARFDSIDSKIQSMDARFDSVDSRMDSLDSKIDSVDSKIDSVELRLNSKFEDIKSDIHQVKLLVEEQNARNVIVLDGLAGLFHRQDRVEKEVIDLRTFVSDLGKP